MDEDVMQDAIERIHPELRGLTDTVIADAQVNAVLTLLAPHR